MKLSSQHLEAFFTVAQTRNFTRASEKLHISQSALSQRILNLESEMESTLFIRERAGLKLTSTGEELLRYCQTTTALEQEFLGRIESPKSNRLSGYIRIAGFSSVMRSVVLPALTPLLAANPDLRLNFMTKELRELPVLLRQGEIDFMILDHNVEKEDLVMIPLGVERNVLVEKKGYIGPDVYLDHDEDDDVTYKYFRNKGSPKKKLDRLFVDDIYGLLDGVERGLGRAVMPVHLIKERNGLRILNSQNVLKLPVVLFHYDQPYYTKLHQMVVQTLTKNAGQYL